MMVVNLWLKVTLISWLFCCFVHIFLFSPFCECVRIVSSAKSFSIVEGAASSSSSAAAAAYLDNSLSFKSCVRSITTLSLFARVNPPLVEPSKESL